MVLAIIAGYIIGTVLAFFFSRRALDFLAAKLGRNDEQRRWIRMVGGIFGAMSLAPAIFVAVLAGGFVGGERYLETIVGLTVVISIMVTSVSSFGGTCGYLISRNLFTRNAGLYED